MINEKTIKIALAVGFFLIGVSVGHLLSPLFKLMGF